jgi:phosphoribosylformylglycinamidine synthase
MKLAVLQFPGSNCDQDCVRAIPQVAGLTADLLWHKETSLGDADAVIVPGGFSYGDYLRCGAIARFSPIMAAVKRHAEAGGLVIGICNGFQILCETGLLPGALVRNRDLHFICEHVHVRVELYDTPFTKTLKTGQVLKLPIAHGEGCYFADEETLDALDHNGQVVLRYCDDRGRTTDAVNPNGSRRHIAGITNRARNVFGLMPHPERACDETLGSTDGRNFFESLIL